MKEVTLKISKILNSGKPVFNKISLRKEELIKQYPNLSRIKNFIRWKSKIKFNAAIYKKINNYKKNYNLF